MNSTLQWEAINWCAMYTLRNHQPGLTLPLLTLFILMPFQAFSYPDEPVLTSLLGSITVDIASINKQTENTAPRYRLTYEKAFPCSVNLAEEVTRDGVHWQKDYRFELSDIETGSLISAREGRRAISYYATRTMADEQVKEYPPKKINAIRLEIADPPGARAELLNRLDQAITLCEERNAF